MNPFLPEEIIIEILKKSSLKSLHRLKWVSKSWYSLIINEVLLPQSVKYPNPYIYYKYRNDRGDQPFLLAPPANRNEDHTILNSFDLLLKNEKISILDSCNGLILCLDRTSYSYFVCNPADKTYSVIPITNRYFPFCLLDFNPLKSPHYRFVSVRWSAFYRALEFDVYHSSRQRFQKVLVHVQHLLDFEWRRSNIALWNGYVYFHCCVAAHQIEGYEWTDLWWPVWTSLKISGVLQEGAGADRDGKNIIGYRMIKFPGGVDCSRKGELCSYMGTWKEKLRFVSISAQGIKAWALRDEDEDEWRLEHDCATTFLGLSEHFWLSWEVPKVVGFHPLCNVLLLIFKHILYAFDFDRSSFETLWEFDKERVLLSYSVLPFYPCFANQILA